MPYVKNSKGKNVYVNPNKSTSSSSSSSSSSSTSKNVIDAILSNPGISDAEKAKWADTSTTYKQKVSTAYKEAGISENPVEQLKDVTVVEIPNTPSPSETVIVEGLGYSVAPVLQESFIANLPPIQTTTSSSSSNIFTPTPSPITPPQSSLSNITPAATISIPSPIETSLYGGTTTDNSQFIVPDIEVMTPGTIYSYQISSVEDKYGKDVPVYQTKTIGEDWGSRPATSSEIAKLNPMTETIGTGRTTKLGMVYGETLGNIKEFSAQDWDPGTYFSNELSDFSSKGGAFRQATVGTLSGIIPETKGDLLKTGFEFGIGAGIGAGVKGGGLLLSSVPKVGQYAAPTFKIGALGTGVVLTGAYALNTAGMIAATPDYYSKGEIFGESALSFAAIGLGYGAGSKGAEMLYGLKTTRGRTEIPLSNMLRESVISGKESFPLAPSSTHLKLFQETKIKIPELTEGKPGGFHVTPEKFWSKEITPQAGTSELPGLYVSSEPSIHFGKIAGGSSSSLFKLPTLKSITSGNKPAIAFLKPERFREVGFEKVTPYKIGEQEFKFEFKQSAKQGFIDVPKLKNEIEGVARIDAGSYIYESGKYYTTIRGVRVPIDVFKAGKGEIKLNLDVGKKGKGFSSEQYGYIPERTSLLDVRSSLGKSLGSPSYSTSISNSMYVPNSSYSPSSSNLLGGSSYSQPVIRGYSGGRSSLSSPSSITTSYNPLGSSSTPSSYSTKSSSYLGGGSSLTSGLSSSKSISDVSYSPKSSSKSSSYLGGSSGLSSVGSSITGSSTGRSNYGFTSGGRNFNKTFNTFPNQKMNILKFPQLGLYDKSPILRSERIFVETPTFGNVLGEDIGIVFKTSKMGGYSGLGERKYKKGIKLPTTFLGKVQNKEFKL